MEEITVEKIKERIKENLRKANDQNFATKANETIERLESITDPNQSIKCKNIRIGMKYKHLIKKIPLINTVARNFYRSMVYNSISKPTFAAKKTKESIIKIPFFGFLIWWLYMILRTPRKISQLSAEANELRGRDEALESKISQVFSEVSELGGKDEALESKISQLSAEANERDKKIEDFLSQKMDGLKSEITNRDKTIEDISYRLQGINNQLTELTEYKFGGIDKKKWAGFYSKEITEKDMDGNIEHHRYFIDLIFDWANKFSCDNIPKLIEIGLGTATMSIYLSKRYFEVIGLDVDPLIVAKAIETNSKLGGHAKFIAMDAFELPRFFKEKSFEIAFSQGTMEHFNNDDLKRILRAQLAVAKYVIYSVPSINWSKKDFGNERKMTLDEWRNLLNDFGFKIEHISYYQEGDLHIAVVLGK